MSDNNHFVNLVKINLRVGRKQQLNFGVLQFVLVVVVFSFLEIFLKKEKHTNKHKQ